MDILSQIRALRDYFANSLQLALIHDAKGKILDILNSADSLQSPGLAWLLNKTKELNSIYDFNPSGMEKWPLGKGFVQKRSPSARLEDTDIYTTLPHTILFTRSIGPDHYFATIRNFLFAPNIIVKNLSSVMFVDMTENRLAGFNQSFFDLFKAEFKNPEALLGAPMADLLSPTPLQMQNEMAAKLNPDDFNRSAVENQKLNPAYAKGWAADIDSLQTKIDTRASAFRLTLRAEFDGDNCPFCIIGDAYDPGQDSGLDLSGYMLGIEGNFLRPVIKKSTFIVARNTPVRIPAGPHTLDFCCKDRTLAFFLDGKLLISFYDDDFIHRSEAVITVGRRKGYRAEIESAKLSLMPNKESGARIQPVLVRLKTPGEDSFLLEPFYNTALSLHYFQHVGGYLLSNVTDLQQRAQALETRIRKYARDESRLKKTITRLKEGESLFVSDSPELLEIRKKAVRAAATNAAILITGETGTGKEVLARYIHETGPRAERPFIKVDCATIPGPLLESQLFGHVRGAFTGAAEDHEGFFEQADRGTLFLDEVGNLDLQTQSKLLQFFNDYTLTPLGGTEARRMDVHCLLATNSDLRRMVKAGKFREDLFYRIYGIVFTLPPLRKRPLDIPLLCRHFLAEHAKKGGRNFKGFSKGAMDKLLSWEWPGNVRELQTAVQRAALFSEDETIDARDILLSKAKEVRRKKRTPYRISLTDKKVVEAALHANLGVITKAAKALGIDRRTLYNFMNSQGLRANDFRQGLKFSISPGEA